MADLEQQLNSILSNPDLMNQIFAMAGNMNAAQNPQQQNSQSQNQQSQQNPQMRQSSSMPFDVGSIQNMMNLMKRTQLEPRQMELLKALNGYLPADRIDKLRKAMLASKIAQFASSAFSAPQNQGR